jgi:hypothetical protein
MATARKVIFHLGGGDISEKNELKWNKPITPPKILLPPEMQSQQETSTKPLSRQSKDDIWFSLTFALQKMNAIQPEKQFGF